MAAPQVAVLAVQGDFALHQASVDALGVRTVLARTAAQVLSASHLILPGGESTTMLKFLEAEGLEQAIVDFAHSGRPILATCAGVILLAREVRGPAQRSLGVLDVVAVRNAYGRQVASFTEPLPCPTLGEPPMEAVYIRAPILCELGSGVEVLARRASSPVLVRQGNIVAATFHPELTSDLRVHQLLLGIPAGIACAVS